MQVFVTGATRTIGRPLVHQLLNAGYDVFGMIRSPHKADLLTQQEAM